MELGTDTEELSRSVEKGQGHRSVEVLDDPCGELPGARPCAPDPLKLGGDAPPDGVPPCRGVRAAGDDAPVGHEDRLVRHGRAMTGDDGHRRDSGGGDVDSARPDASPVASSRHCSPTRLGSCPPACRCMGSARANRSGWLPESVWKEFVRWEPRGATSEA